LPIPIGGSNIRVHARSFQQDDLWKGEKMKTEITISRRSMTAVLFSAFLALTAWVQLSAQSSDFPSLQKHINKQVTVDTSSGQVRGQLLRVEENRLVVYEAGSPKPIARELVMRVTKHKSRHTAAWVGGMTAAGLSTGWLIGLQAFNDAPFGNRKIATAGLVGAGVGAAGGYALSRIGKRDEVIYERE
jgi:hypothetical protein